MIYYSASLTILCWALARWIKTLSVVCQRFVVSADDDVYSTRTVGEYLKGRWWCCCCLVGKRVEWERERERSGLLGSLVLRLRAAKLGCGSKKEIPGCESLWYCGDVFYHDGASSRLATNDDEQRRQDFRISITEYNGSQSHTAMTWQWSPTTHHFISLWKSYYYSQRHCLCYTFELSHCHCPCRDRLLQRPTKMATNHYYHLSYTNNNKRVASWW